MTPLDLAWAAGIMEGEGTIRIAREHRATGAIGVLYVSMSNTDTELVGWFHERWPGHVSAQRGPLSQRPGWAQAWRWELKQRRAAAFLEQIGPYVKSQRVRQKLDLALEFQSQKAFLGRSPLRFAYVAAQLAFYERMRELNQKGPGVPGRAERFLGHITERR